MDRLNANGMSRFAPIIRRNMVTARQMVPGNYLPRRRLGGSEGSFFGNGNDKAFIARCVISYRNECRAVRRDAQMHIGSLTARLCSEALYPWTNDIEPYAHILAIMGVRNPQMRVFALAFIKLGKDEHTARLRVGDQVLCRGRSLQPHAKYRYIRHQ